MKYAIAFIGALLLAGCGYHAMTTAEIAKQISDCRKAGLEPAYFVRETQPGVIVMIQCQPKKLHS